MAQDVMVQDTFLQQMDKKFSCQYCDFRSTTSYNVSSHVKSVHSRIKVGY